MTRTSSIHTLSTMVVGRPLAVAALMDMGLTADTNLLAPNDAALQGKGIAWEDGAVEIRPLTSLPRASLEALMELRKEFARIRQKKGYADAKAGGVSVAGLRELPPRKAAAADAGGSVSMFTRFLAAHGFTRTSRKQRFADVCAKWEAGAISKQTAVGESGVSITEFNVLLRKAGMPLHFAGERPRWLEKRESGIF